MIKFDFVQIYAYFSNDYHEKDMILTDSLNSVQEVPPPRVDIRVDNFWVRVTFRVRVSFPNRNPYSNTTKVSTLMSTPIGRAAWILPSFAFWTVLEYHILL